MQAGTRGKEEENFVELRQKRIRREKRGVQKGQQQRLRWRAEELLWPPGYQHAQDRKAQGLLRGAWGGGAILLAAHKPLVTSARVPRQCPPSHSSGTSVTSVLSTAPIGW